MIAATTPAEAGPTGWAHQAAGFQSNGAVTVKSLSGGSFAGTQNPTGAVAKANQSAATQAPTVIIQATSANTPNMVFTTTKYNGNLGGLAGADAKCVAEFGSGWKFAEVGKLASGVPMTLGGIGPWINNTDVASCNAWTSTAGSSATLLSTSSGAWNMVTGQSCGFTNRLACVNY